MEYSKPIILTIAGFDPTGGAGVLADVKTAEQIGCIGMAVLTANTIQTESNFIAANWLNIDQIKSQLIPLLENYSFTVVKFGIIQDLNTLEQIATCIRSYQPNCIFIWDTVLASSSGFELFTVENQQRFLQLIQTFTLITPNANEVKRLTQHEDEIQAANELSQYVAVLLKGGHRTNQLGEDILFQVDRKTTIQAFYPNEQIFPKHGSGCILSSAISAYLAQGNDLEKACRLGKQFVEERLRSNSNLLAYYVE